MIRELIRKKFDIKLSEVSVGRLMKRMGFTPQRPLYLAWQQNADLGDQWKKHEYPKIVKKAKKRVGSYSSLMKPVFDLTTIRELVELPRVTLQL